MNKKNVTMYIVGFALVAVIVVVALYMANINGDELGGADDAGGDIVAEVDPDYEPWTAGIWGDYELPGETESMLFALQAAIGAIIIGYFIGRYSKSKAEREAEAKIEAEADTE